MASISGDTTEMLGLILVGIGALALAYAAFLVALIAGFAVAGAICAAMGVILVRIAHRAAS